VQMKRDIQQKLLDEERQFGTGEARRRRNERVRNNPILGPFATKRQAGRSAPLGHQDESAD
jgi:hypothetical protein